MPQATRQMAAIRCSATAGGSAGRVPTSVGSCMSRSHTPEEARRHRTGRAAPSPTSGTGGLRRVPLEPAPGPIRTEPVESRWKIWKRRGFGSRPSHRGRLGRPKGRTEPRSRCASDTWGREASRTPRTLPTTRPRLETRTVSASVPDGCLRHAQEGSTGRCFCSGGSVAGFCVSSSTRVMICST
jgi:hypothetical protein